MRNRLLILVTLSPCHLVTLSLLTAGEMKAEVKLSKANPRMLQTHFGNYGYRPGRTIFPEVGGFRFRLPAGLAPVSQTGVYSYFALAGDCEVTVTYDLVNVPMPRSGYGSGVGLAFDAGAATNRGSIQRVVKPKDGSGYVLQTNLAQAGKEAKEEYRWVPTTAKRGRIGLRRIKNELFFLASDTTSAPLQEIDHLPFTDGTIRAVRVFADTGGALSPVDVRVGHIRAHAEEITGGTPLLEETASRWWPWLLGLAPVAALAWYWRRRRRESEE